MRPALLNIPALVLASTALVLTGLPLHASDLDRRIETSAKQTYNFRTYLRVDNIKVECSAGVVTLTGAVIQESHRSLAQETVSGLPGVKGVINLLVLAGEQPPALSDPWITMKVKAALAFHKSVSATETAVRTQNGVVTLSGNTDTEARKELTGEYAMDVEGVTEVHNEMVVTPGMVAPERFGERMDDASITAQVKTTLLFHKSTHALATKVSTREGVVTLRGEARNAAEKSLVTRIAEDVKGVKQVYNLMTLRQP
jgi:osmotically-inducible protein OsmY